MYIISKTVKWLEKGRALLVFIFFTGLFICTTAEQVFAVPPLDFIVNTGGQLAYILGFVGAFCSTVTGLFFIRLGLFCNTPLKRKILWIIFLSGLSMIFYAIIYWSN